MKFRLSAINFSAFRPDGSLEPFRLLRSDIRNILKRYASDWTVFNQLILASAVFVFCTNLLPGITFASDLDVATGKQWGTIEVVFKIFSLLNSVIYVHKAIQVLQRAYDSTSFASFLYSIISTTGTLFLAVLLSTAEIWRPIFHRYVRMGLREYAAAISIITLVGISHAGRLETLDQQFLAVSKSFRPSSPDRSVFFVQFWHLPVTWVFAALIPGLIITVLFFFDHEVSSIICTDKRYGTSKPSGFAWDIVLLGTTTAMCGILGIPPANGLLPQAPLHSESLMHKVQVTGPVIGNPNAVEKAESGHEGEDEGEETTTIERVYEQRWSHFLHAGGILAFISPPLMHVLGLTPTSVLAGLFLFMGEQSLSVNPLLYRILDLLTPPSELPLLPETIWSYWSIHLYTVAQVAITAGIFAITLTAAAPAFPIIIVALVPLRLFIINRLWSRETLRFIDRWACRDGTPEDDATTND
ncbi:MAG: hypothetical protein M1819_000597 [Sarea resinae]|nr:MAG: hypothetical protein M1819_000597 [Sarea resinae]